MNYKNWVKEADIDSLINALLELYDECNSAKEDPDVWEESGEQLSKDYSIVENEIKKRATKVVG